MYENGGQKEWMREKGETPYTALNHKRLMGDCAVLAGKVQLLLLVDRVQLT